MPREANGNSTSQSTTTTMTTDRQAQKTFPKETRLLSSPQFRNVFDGKRSVSDDTLIVYATRNEAGQSRLGLAVSRKIGNAVVRNAWKRRIREAFRLQRSSIPVGFDFVVLPRRGAKLASAKIHSSLLALCRRAAKRCERVARKGERTHDAPSSKKRHYGRGKGGV